MRSLSRSWFFGSWICWKRGYLGSEWGTPPAKLTERSRFEADFLSKPSALPLLRLSGCTLQGLDESQDTRCTACRANVGNSFGCRFCFRCPVRQTKKDAAPICVLKSGDCQTGVSKSGFYLASLQPPRRGAAPFFRARPFARIQTGLAVWGLCPWAELSPSSSPSRLIQRPRALGSVFVLEDWDSHWPAASQPYEQK